MAECILRYPGPGVINDDFHSVQPVFQRNLDDISLGYITKRVGDKVDDHPFHGRYVYVDHVRDFGDVGFESHASCLAIMH